MTLWPWQESSWAELVRRRAQTGLPHALLLTGVAGIGKHDFALALAKWLLCKTARQQHTAAPCGQCHSCNLWQAGSHPDFVLTQPEEGSRQIRVDDVRKLNDFLAQTPQISHCQVVILRPAEVMNSNAANALLKTLEEPAGESYLILESERFGAILPTIRSRCQRITLRAPQFEQGLSWLQNQGISVEDSTRALQRMHGAPLAARDWLQNGQDGEQEFLRQLKEWQQQRIGLIELSEIWSKLEVSFVTGCFYLVLLDLLKIKNRVPVTQHSLQGAVTDLLGDATFDTAKLIVLLQKVQTTLSQQLAALGNYNKQLFCESLLLQWQDLFTTAR